MATPARSPAGDAGITVSARPPVNATTGIVAYRSPAGPGVRLDAGTAYSGAVIGRHYDSLLVKITASGVSVTEAADRMLRGLSEFRVRGVEPCRRDSCDDDEADDACRSLAELQMDGAAPRQPLLTALTCHRSADAGGPTAGPIGRCRTGRGTHTRSDPVLSDPIRSDPI